MKRLMIMIILMLFVSCLIFGQTKQTAGQNVIQEITALENGWNEASLKYDISWYEKNLADSYSGTDENGVVTDKAGIITDLKNKAWKTASNSYENFKVRVYGDTAIATAVSVYKGIYKGKDASGKFPWTDTWVKIGGHWQCVAGHNSKLPSK
jgi:ketosteroid isomerase-like protein